MKFFYRFRRLMRISYIFIKYNLDEVMFESTNFSLFKFTVYCNPYYYRKHKLARAERIRIAIEKLGPIFVKAAQVLSTRRDIIPEDIAIELTKLQDKVPPFSGELAREIIEKTYLRDITQVFSEFDTTPLASASIAQVHTATLITGESVVVKVLRPKIDRLIENDIDLLLIIAKLANRFAKGAKHFKPTLLVNEVAQTLRDELDLMREAANASQLKRNTKDVAHLHIPKIYWPYCTSNVIVLERIHGIPIHDVAALNAHGVNLRLLAERGIDIFFTQMFRDNFFHADLHPGNIFVNVEKPHDPSYILVDFGIVGSLNQEDQKYIAENLIAFFKRDYQRVAELHLASGWLPPDTRIDQFEGAIRAVSEPILEQPLSQISFGQLLLRLFQVARQFNINIQPQLFLLQKTLLNIEGLCRSLSPEVELWTFATPKIEKWMKHQVGFKAFLERLRENLPYWSEAFPEMPSLIYEVLKETKKEKEYFRYREREVRDVPLDVRLSKKIKYFFSGVILTLASVAIYIHGSI